MWVFNVFLWMLMQVNPEIHEDEYYQLWYWRGTGDPTSLHPDNPK